MYEIWKNDFNVMDFTCYAQNKNEEKLESTTSKINSLIDCTITPGDRSVFGESSIRETNASPMFENDTSIIGNKPTKHLNIIN